MNNEEHIKIYTEKPQGYIHNLEVVACYLKKNNEFLFLKKSKGRNEEQTWGVAGGKMKAGEPPKEATIREVFEETGIVIDPSNLIFKRLLFVENPYYGKFLLYIYSYACELLQEVTLSDEHAEYRWLSLDEAKKLSLLPGGLKSLRLFEDSKLFDF